MLAGRTFVPVIIGRNRFCPLIAANPAIARTCSAMAANSAYQKIVCEDCDRVGRPRRHNFGQRPFVGDVIGDIESGQGLDEKQGEQDEHHPAAGRVVPDLAVGLSPKRILEMPQGSSRRGQEAGKARRLAAKDAPCQPEQNQGEHRFADPSVPDHPVQSPRRIGGRDKSHDEPVEETDKNVPHENDARRRSHRPVLARLSQYRRAPSMPAPT